MPRLNVEKYIFKILTHLNSVGYFHSCSGVIHESTFFYTPIARISCNPDRYVCMRYRDHVVIVRRETTPASACAVSGVRSQRNDCGYHIPAAGSLSPTLNPAGSGQVRYLLKASPVSHGGVHHHHRYLVGISWDWWENLLRKITSGGDVYTL